ncbi:MAG TPA: PilZ domain-containing protein [Rhodoferax sp.]
MNSQQTTHSGPLGQSGRSSERFSSELPVEIGGALGLTRNVSATGVYFETTVDQTPGSKVTFVVEVLVKGERLKMVCAGDVVRVEQKLGTVGIAVKLSSSFFTDTDSAEDPDEQLDD